MGEVRSHLKSEVRRSFVMGRYNIILLLVATTYFVLQCQAAATTGKVVFPMLTSPFTFLPKYTTIFGIHLFSTSNYTDAKFQHMASVMANLIDNNQDGCADTPAVVKKLNAAKVAHVAWNSEGADGSPETSPDALMMKMQESGYKIGALNYVKEVRPECSYPKNVDQCVDSTVEEMTHLVTGQGYSLVFPKVFGESLASKSLLSKAMNIARGGAFTTIPAQYPASAWFTYMDATCLYNCMTTEYLWFGLGSYQGYFKNQKYMLNEFRPITRALLAAKDPKLTALIKDTRTYRLPTVPPTGTYKGKKTCATGTNVV